MDTSHHQAVLAGYATAMLAWLAIRHMLPSLWAGPERPVFARPWLEVVAAVGAALTVLALGQLYLRGWLLPSSGALGPVFGIANQFVVFVPMVLLLVVRRQRLSTAWLPTQYIVARVAIGLVLAVASVAVFTLVRGRLDRWPELVTEIYQPSHIRLAVHVWLEDLTVAILFVRFAAALRRPWLVAVIVAGVFAAGHVPGALATGATLADLAPLLLDAGLAAFVLLVVFRSADIWWFWCVHFALDMTQFVG